MYNSTARPIVKTLLDHAAARRPWTTAPASIAAATYTDPRHLAAERELLRRSPQVVALTPEAKATPEDLQAFCKERLAAYKYPRIVEIVPELPKGPTGKILKRELRDPA